MSKIPALAGAAIIALTAAMQGAACGTESLIRQAPAVNAPPDGQAKLPPTLQPGSADAAGAVLLVDEADSIYGRRKDVPTTNDRHSIKDE